jgi:hypothetical protein
VNSLAISDGLLFLVACYFALQVRMPIAFRLGSAILGAAAILGALRFSGLLPLPQMHDFFSTLGASSAFALVSASVIWPNQIVSLKAKYASILFIISAALGLIMVVGFEFVIFGQLMAFLSVFLVAISSLKNKRIDGFLGALVMATGFLLFTMEYAIPGYLQPGDFLHIFTAVGLVVFGQIHFSLERLKEEY